MKIPTCITLPLDVKNKLLKRARHDGKTQSELAREAIIVFLEQKK